MTQTEILRVLRKNKGRMELSDLSTEIDIDEDRIRNAVERMPKIVYINGNIVMFKEE
jgi:hypothetical protein